MVSYSRDFSLGTRDQFLEPVEAILNGVYGLAGVGELQVAIVT